jgi:Ca2+-binding RTX toxin-like protein
VSYYNYKGIVMPETPAEQGNIRGTSAGNETIQAPDGPSSVSGEGGGDTLLGSNGGNRFWITDAHDKVVEPVAGGIDTEIGWVPIILAHNVENAAVYQSYSYAVGNDLDNLIVVGDDQHQWLYGAKGDDVLVGGAGADTFLVRAGEGSDVIYGWNPSDQLKLVGYNFPTPAAVMAAMTQVGPDVVVRLSPA